MKNTKVQGKIRSRIHNNRKHGKHGKHGKSVPIISPLERSSVSVFINGLLEQRNKIL